MDRLSDERIAADLRATEWRREGEAIVRDLELPGFTAAIAFVGRVAEAAEAADHHPDILIHGYKRVRLTLTTHSAGGLTEGDLVLARTIDGLAPGA